MIYLKNLADEYLQVKWIVWTLFLFGYGWISRQDVMTYTQVDQKAINQWDILFSFWGDPFFIFYFFLPVWIFFCIKLIYAESRLLVFIRSKTELGWMRHVFFRLHFMLVVNTAIWLFVSLLLTLGVPYELGWSPWALGESYFNAGIAPVVHLGIPPIFLFMLQVVLLIVFLSCLYTALCVTHLLTARPAIMIALGTVLYIGAIISFKMFPADWIWIKASSYSILSASYYDLHSLWVGLIVQLILIALGWGVIAAKKRWEG
ncbi:hypothetical protein [Saccharibacillus deserti]|uniref:hypothetical protein n=1 Tax=Saccharibacillus deserti TaxID=1634444 RepID=UPI0015535057|nr:hypothetical protein [Saccharibacillus deserti]